MTDEQSKEKNTLFTAEDRLRLLQLMTRRAIAERKGRSAETQGADTAEEAQQTAPKTIPKQWRLVPENTVLYDWQRECLPLWLARGRGTVKVATGGGKTLFALAAAQTLQNEHDPDLRLVIVVPTIPLLFQWYDEIRKGNLPASAIGLMGGGQEVPPASNLRILICVLNSAREKLPSFVLQARWHEHLLLVVDECHRANAAQARRIFETNPRYTLGLSATPEQDRELEGLPTDEAYEKSVVGQALGPIIYDFTIRQSLEAGLLTPFEVWHIGLPLSPTEYAEHEKMSREIADLRKALQKRHQNSRSTQGFLAWCQTQASRGGPAAADAERFIGLANRRKRLLYTADARTTVTLGVLADSIADPDGRAIVFHESIDEIEALFFRALQMGLPAVLEHSNLPDGLRAENIEAFRRGIARVIISAKSLVEGFNVPSADLGIIAASSGAVRQRIQSLGRLLRRKAGGRTARVIVLYVRDTEDEAIYEKADWERIVGAERSRYFHWMASPEDRHWSEGLKETLKPPRIYRPPSWEVDVSTLRLGDRYPGQTGGLDLRVDQGDNLRTDDGTLVPVPTDFVMEIMKQNPYRRARRTPAGHLIVRSQTTAADEENWLYIGEIDLPDEPAREKTVKLRLKTVSGKRVIALEEDRRKGIIRFARGPGDGRTQQGGFARDRLLQWVRTVEAQRNVSVKEIFWDGKSRYWLEIRGERIHYDGDLAPLEF